MKGKNKTLLKGIIFFTLILFVFFTISVLAEEEKSSLNLDSVKDSNGENSFSFKNFSSSGEEKSIVALNLFQLIKKENVSNKIELAIEESKGNVNYEQNRLLKKYVKGQQVERSFYTTSMITLVGLNIADYLSTTEAIKYDGLKEGNPIVKQFAKNSILFAVAKLGLTAYSYHFLQKLYKKNKSAAWLLSAIANIGLSYIVLNNMRLINKYKDS